MGFDKFRMQSEPDRRAAQQQQRVQQSQTQIAIHRDNVAERVGTVNPQKREQ